MSRCVVDWFGLAPDRSSSLERFRFGLKRFRSEPRARDRSSENREIQEERRSLVGIPELWFLGGQEVQIRVKGGIIKTKRFIY